MTSLQLLFFIMTFFMHLFVVFVFELISFGRSIAQVGSCNTHFELYIVVLI